jgi:transcription-repair coupling factor (superfamily II helicase)
MASQASDDAGQTPPGRHNPGRVRALVDRYSADPRAAALAQALRTGTATVMGACHGAVPAVLLASCGVRPSLVVTHDPQRLAEDLEEMGLQVAVLAELERFSDEEDGTADGAGWQRRAAALEAFANGAWLLSSPAATAQPVPDLAETVARSRVLRPGQTQDPQALAERLVEGGFRMVTAVEGRGEVAIRGGILDVFPWIGEQPLRIEFFGDQVDSIRRFDPFSQESTARVEEAVLAAPGIGLATRDLWSQLPPGPIVVMGDMSLRSRLAKDHGRSEVRLARQLESGATDGETVGVERLRGDLRKGLAELTGLLGEVPESRALLLSRSEEAAEELRAHIRDAGLTERAEAAVGRVSGGWRDLATGLIVVHDYELAERAPAKKRARVAGGAPLDSLAELRRGDLCVHLQHGICRFQGMATLEKRGYMEDFLILEFAEESKLYVPVDAIDLVQKYVGGGGRDPQLTRIGGKTWSAAKARAEKAVADMSGELLQNQAARIAVGGFACPPDTADMRRFDAEFPFEETADQLSAVREIKADMERPVAMDRLLCGDVGFGKTEVAMRAAFKAVQAGRQVAVLVPTTILAEQHCESFNARMSPFGVKVAGLDRFRSGKEAKEVMARTAAGEIDVLVGTHALLNAELKFRDLGLLVVDEEHRFGVKHKEQLKRLRAGVDVLTLSATPIPRTLHFSMLGLRDISVLAEPPSERLAVETRVCPWDDELVSHAVVRELEREGQLFVVQNRITDLDTTAWRLQQLAAKHGFKLRAEVVHGQMDEDRIARAMDAFRTKTVDCLISTSIIESGIDIPNANTLFVIDAQRFGLAELHQLRGRIGRFTRQAFAYFLTPPKREIGEEARERLAAIQEYAELGAGFKLAMRDLELRGAGNLLGAEQSGTIDAIGYELYTRLLTEAVSKARHQAEAAAGLAPKPADTSAPTLAAPGSGEAVVGIHLDAYIPDDWLEATQLKFELHRSIDRAKKMPDLENAARLARDRFGQLPQPVLRLLRIKAIRIRLRQLGIMRIDVGDRRLRLHLKGQMPKELIQARLPEIIHVQPDGPVLVLFLRPELTQDVALDIMGRLFGTPAF